MWPLKRSPGAEQNEGARRSRLRRTKDRQRMLFRWRRPALIAAFVLLPALALAGGGYWTWQSYAGRALSYADAGFEAVVRRADLSVREVFVHGRIRAPLKEVAAAVSVKRGDSMFSVDPVAIRARLLALGWVKEATVTRWLPNEIHIQLAERTPIALYQVKRRLSLIDAEGAVITTTGLERFAKLPIVVGKGARATAGELIALLASQPSLYPLVEAAVRVGDRRWNIKLRNGIEINLPSEKADRAWAKLAELEVKHGIFKRDVSTIDLRLPDRLVVRMTPGGVAKWRLQGKNT